MLKLLMKSIKNKKEGYNKMPDHLKDAPNTREFSQYLQGFIGKQTQKHRTKVFAELVATVRLMLAE